MKRSIRSAAKVMVIAGALSVVPTFMSSSPTLTSAQLSSNGYYLVTSNGVAITAGNAPGEGSIPNHPADIVASFAVPGGGGYWMVSKSGRVYSFGNAHFYGDTYTDGITGLTGSKPLNAPIVGGAPTANGKGYWLVAADGGVFNFGDASFHGSTYTYGITGLSGSRPLNAPIVGMVADPEGSGYWLIAADGGIFNFGGAPFYGSTYSLGLTGLTGSRPLDAPIVDVYPSQDGRGYYMVAADGGVFNFGDAKFSGSAYDYGYTGLGGKHPLPAPVTAILPNPDGPGYYISCSNGQVIAIGGAPSEPLHGAVTGKVISIVPAGSTSSVSQPQSVTPPPPPPSVQTPSPTQPQQSSQPIEITTTSLPAGETNAAYSYQLSATGGSGQYQWSATNLPAGLALSSSGLLSGTPEYETNNDTVDVVVSDSQNDTAHAALSLTISASSYTASSDNWSGYLEKGNDFTSVSGEFTIGSLSPSQPSVCSAPYACSTAQWVGIGGLQETSGTSIIQAGVSQFSIGNGQYQIEPWVETFPNASLPVYGMSVNPGDSIWIAIEQTSPGQWMIKFDNVTTGEELDIPETYSGETTSAEWITEAENIAGQQTVLAPYTGVYFNDLTAIGNVNQNIELSMAQDGQTVSTITNISSSGFSTTYE